MELKHEIVEWIKVIVIAVILAFIVKVFLFESIHVSGTSMMPTLKHSDRLISSKLPLYNDNIARGDIIVFNSPYDSKEKFVKRVIGLPKDQISIRDGRVYLNDKMLGEEYLSAGIETICYDNDEWLVGEGELFVLGDNRGMSNDSREFGCIPKKDVFGISNLRFYPFSDMGKVK